MAKNMFDNFFTVGRVTPLLLRIGEIGQKHKILNSKTTPAKKEYVKKYVAFCKDVEKEIKRVYGVK